MNLDAFAIKLLLLVVPGYLGYALSMRIRTNSSVETDAKTSFVFINIFVFTVLCYMTHDLVFYLINLLTGYSRTSIFAAFYDANLRLDVNDFMILIAISLLLGVVYSWLENRNLINRFFRFLGLSNVTNQGDLWSNMVVDKEFEWIVLRDHNTGLAYNGYIKAFSESGKTRELVLGDVEVSDSATGKRLYVTERIYLSRECSTFTIEVKPVKPKEKKNAK